MTNNCIFCKIVNGEIPSFKLYEDENCIVILDKFPATKGQSLVISKKHEDYIVKLDDRTYSSLFLAAKNVAKAIDMSLKTVRTCFVVEGFEVSHAHIRLHPSYDSKLHLKGVEEDNSKLEETKKLILKSL